MNILKKQYAKVIDKITIELAPDVLNNIMGFNNSETLCNANGYYFLKYSPQTGNTATYIQVGNTVVQSWVDIDHEEYANQVVSKIREKYSENEELAILRKSIAEIDSDSFLSYNAFCEKIKKDIKLVMIQNNQII
jgi:hypothetical protein